MKILVMILGLSILLSTLAFAENLSNTIPTNQLVGSFNVNGVRNASGALTAVVNADLYQIIMQSNGTPLYQHVVTSDDETLSVSVGNVSIKFDLKKPAANILPYVPGGVYTFNFRRFNGESYSSQATMIAPVSIVRPTAGQTVKKNEAVVIEWNDIAEASYSLSVLITRSCAPKGNLTFTASTATIPGGFTEGCSSPTEEDFTITYGHLGTPYGVLKGAAVAATSASILFDQKDSVFNARGEIDFHWAMAKAMVESLKTPQKIYLHQDIGE